MYAPNPDVEEGPLILNDSITIFLSCCPTVKQKTCVNMEINSYSQCQNCGRTSVVIDKWI